MNFQVLYDRVVVKKTVDTKVSASGIIIAADSKERTITSEVVAVGDGKQYENGNVIPTTVKVGERVMYLKDTGIDIKIDGVDYLILHESEILGIIE